jgi:phenylacetate-CoA ligase
MSNDGNVKEFIIEQTELDTFKIQYVADKALSQQEKNAVQKSVFEYLEKDLKLIFERTTVLKRSKSGKLKQFISLIKI